MRINFVLLALIATVCALLVGCGSTIQVSRTAPEEEQIRLGILDLRNCDMADDLHTTLASKAPVSEQITVVKLATSATTGESYVIPDEMLATLEADIESAYQSVFEQAVESAEQVEIFVPANKIRMYEIRWKQQVFRSTVKFEMNDQDCSTGYTYVLVVSELGKFTEMACTG